MPQAYSKIVAITLSAERPRRSSLLLLFLSHWCVVVVLSFVHSYEMPKKVLLIAVQCLQILLWNGHKIAAPIWKLYSSFCQPFLGWWPLSGSCMAWSIVTKRLMPPRLNSVDQYFMVDMDGAVSPKTPCNSVLISTFVLFSRKRNLLSSQCSIYTPHLNFIA